MVWVFLYPQAMEFLVRRTMVALFLFLKPWDFCPPYNVALFLFPQPWDGSEGFGFLLSLGHGILSLRIIGCTFNMVALSFFSTMGFLSTLRWLSFSFFSSMRFLSTLQWLYFFLFLFFNHVIFVHLTMVALFLFLFLNHGIFVHLTLVALLLFLNHGFFVRFWGGIVLY